ncbi:hypothetical protein K7472_17635 [Streptomyces sp. PTM05]|uniref:Uncharacterized protein n=1 Tax=Streptantibioticus parmotrematis TaxID=2873249 RepID=A0ABS7QTZ5_9ACTN|nr:hypothetical protein [Streptantibioticus parmotrematis]MBY8886673.1 hypothetical protein [Streptantibioticus parmotrematis]
MSTLPDTITPSVRRPRIDGRLVAAREAARLKLAFVRRGYGDVSVEPEVTKNDRAVVTVRLDPIRACWLAKEIQR